MWSYSGLGNLHFVENASSFSVAFILFNYSNVFYQGVKTIFSSFLSPGQTIATCQHNISQHCWGNMLRVFGHHVAMCCDMLGVVGSSLKMVKFDPTHPTCRNTVAKRTQHVAPNNVAMCCVGRLRSFGRGFRIIVLSLLSLMKHSC